MVLSTTYDEFLEGYVTQYKISHPNKRKEILEAICSDIQKHGNPPARLLERKSRYDALMSIISQNDLSQQAGKCIIQKYYNPILMREYSKGIYSLDNFFRAMLLPKNKSILVREVERVLGSSYVDWMNLLNCNSSKVHNTEILDPIWVKQLLEKYFKPLGSGLKLLDLSIGTGSVLLSSWSCDFIRGYVGTDVDSDVIECTQKLKSEIIEKYKNFDTCRIFNEQAETLNNRFLGDCDVVVINLPSIEGTMYKNPHSLSAEVTYKDENHYLSSFIRPLFRNISNNSSVRGVLIISETELMTEKLSDCIIVSLYPMLSNIVKIANQGKKGIICGKYQAWFYSLDDLKSLR